MKKNKSKFLIFMIFINSVILAGANYVKANYSLINFEEILFALKSGFEGSDNSIFFTSALRILPFCLMLFLIFYTLFFDITFGKKVLKTKKGMQIYPVKFLNLYKKLLIWILFILSIISVLSSIGFFNYIFYSFSKSDFIEKNYVDSKKVEIKFKEKRNLILIMVESLETSYFSKKQNGYWDYELIPELYDLLSEKSSVTFYNNNKKEGINMINSSSWTTASVVSNLSGVPLKVNLTDESYNNKKFLNNTYALGDLLKDNGYNNELISAARTNYGGINEYFSIHGKYSIIDENSLEKYNLAMNKNDIGPWGFNDKYLFETAKKRLEVLSKDDKPFNLQLITIDTHFVDGFVGNYSVKKYKRQYENAFATESKLIYDFISYIKKQAYYKDTTIVIIGDHLTMQSNMFEGKKVKDRYIYNCIINSQVKPVKSNKRIITSVDYYPTIVYAIGGNIKGDRLGLGTNLYSNKQTLIEKYGFEKYRKELKKQSKFYNDKILK